MRVTYSAICRKVAKGFNPGSGEAHGRASEGRYGDHTMTRATLNKSTSSRKTRTRAVTKPYEPTPQERAAMEVYFARKRETTPAPVPRPVHQGGSSERRRGAPRQGGDVDVEELRRGRGRDAEEQGDEHCAGYEATHEWTSCR